jgi:putative membrane protein
LQQDAHGMYFSAEQIGQLNQAVRDLEHRTGVQIVTAVVDKADAYPEIPWKAFALGSAASALGVLAWQALRPVLLAPLAQSVSVLGIGAAAALATIFWPAFARLFLDAPRAAGETEQYARALFLERQIFDTPARTGILLLVTLFEHRVIVLPDSGVGRRLDPSALHPVVARMTGLLRRGDRFAALVQGLAVLETALTTAGFTAEGPRDNSLPDNLIQRKGERP